MSVPPQLIRVKRKATEEAPVSFLRVQENKRHRSEAFVYQRKEEPQFAESIPPEISKPIIHISQSHPHAPTFQSSKTPDPGVVHRDVDNGTLRDPANTPLIKSTGHAGVTSEPRRFHMSRKEMMLETSHRLDLPHGGVSKKRSAPTLFVERKIKRISSKYIEKFQAAANAVIPAPAPAQTAAPTPAVTSNMEVDKPEARKFKKPGVAKLAKKEDGQKYKADLPKSMTERWNVDMDKLTAEMNAYTMQQIGLNLQRVNDEKEPQPTAKTQSRFKPNPIKRFAERHPELAQDSADTDMMDTDADMSDSDDSDYVIETYERVPASKIGEHVKPHNIGILVFDEEPDLEYFYGEGGDSEDEWAEDEEDENAENYYAADYPDEEVASDDEFDKNPYSFRTENASDLEEYDLDDEDEDVAFSDKEDVPKSYTTYIGRPRDEFSKKRL
ncbi:hypothetical protein F5Y04DRAFT_116148 [Hypomontagnella monticulosa]|nr:hypothetical protein F5Y04DRAFT_116148 [Hypomontagnella monticulosa]